MGGNFFTSLLQLDYPLDGDSGAILTLRALERDGAGSSSVLWILLAVFAALVLAVIIISLWKVPPDVRYMFGGRGGEHADNLFLPVDLFMKDPGLNAAGSLPAEKIYLRSIGFNRLVLLTEHPVTRGQDIWLSVKKIPYFHGKREFIRARLRTSRRLGDHWYVNEASVVHEGREADQELSVFIRDLRAVPTG